MDNNIGNNLEFSSFDFFKGIEEYNEEDLWKTSEKYDLEIKKPENSIEDKTGDINNNFLYSQEKSEILKVKTCQLSSFSFLKEVRKYTEKDLFHSSEKDDFKNKKQKTNVDDKEEIVNNKVLNFKGILLDPTSKLIEENINSNNEMQFINPDFNGNKVLIHPFIEEEISRLKNDKKIVIRNQDLSFHCENKRIKPNITSDEFIQKMNLIYESKVNTVDHVSCFDKASLIFHNAFSRKRKRKELNLYFDNKEENLGKGSVGVVRKIVHVSSNRKKAIKESYSSDSNNKKKIIKNNKLLYDEYKSLTILHESLPVDSYFKENHFKHLGFQDAFDGVGTNSDGKIFLLGTCYEGDGNRLILNGTKETLAACFQLLFGLRALDHAKCFNHDIKASNTLYARDPNFCFPLRIGFSDIHVLHRDEIISLYKKKKINLDYPFEDYTGAYMPKPDLAAIKGYLKKLKTYETESKDFTKTVDEIMFIRQQNMVSLVGQTIFLILTGSKYSGFTRKGKRKEFKAQVLKNLKEVFQADKKKSDMPLCQKINNLIISMTKLKYSTRPTPKESLETFLKIIKKYDIEMHNLIVEKRWTDGYANWKK